MSEQEHNHKDAPDKGKGFLREFFKLGEVGNYFFRRKDAKRPSNINIKMMHGINRLAIFIFIIGVMYLILKRLF
jgi:hypothetical protein